MSVNSVQSGAAAGLVRAAEQNPEVAAKLLKKVEDTDKNLVNTLLPVAGPTGQNLNVGA